MLFKKREVKNAKVVVDESKKPSNIKILGGGCKNCETLEKNVRTVLKKLGWEIEIEHITDFSEIAKYGVMTTPALVLDEKLASYGRVLSENEILKIFA